MNDRDNPLLVGVDFGTTNIKAIVFDVHGQPVAQASRPTPTRYPQPGRAYYEPEELWQRTVEALRQATGQIEDPSRIASVAFASLGETAIPLDAEDRATYHAIAWFDPRTKPQAAWLDQVVGRDRLFSITGLSLSEIFGLCKVLWFQQEEPEAFARTVKWLNVADFLAYRLSGVAATDYSLASRMLALDLRNLRWADDMLAEAGVSSELFAPLRSSGTDLGPVLPEIARATGLPESARVAVGGHDHVCGALAVGAVSPGMALNSVGTSEVMFLPLQEPLSDPQLGRQGYEVGVHVDGEHYYTWGSIRTSGACVDWFRDLFAEEMDYASLIAEGRQVAPGSLGVCFLPHLRSAATPHFDEKALGAFVGLSTDVNRGAMFRAVLEGVAFEIYDAVETLLPYVKTPVSTMYAIGGGTRNTLLMEIKAAVFDNEIQVVDMQEAVALGAAMLGGVAARVYGDVGDAMARIEHSRTVIEPDAEQAAVYATLFRQVYQQMYASLRPLSHAIHNFREQSLQR
jgi:xylulokinase